MRAYIDADILIKTEPVDQGRIDEAALLYRKWHPSHGIDINDAILAATAMQTGGKIFCLNRKHYPMTEVLVTKAWQDFHFHPKPS